MYVIGRGRYAREAYPQSPAAGGGGGGCPAAVVFSPDPPCTPSTTIRSARSANQSPITGTPVGATNLGSDTSGTTTGVSGDYATVGGGDQNVASADHTTIAGGLNNRATAPFASALSGIDALALAVLALAIGGDEALATASASVAIGTETAAVNLLATAINGGQAYGDEAFAAAGGAAATGDASIAMGAGSKAGTGPFAFTLPGGAGTVGVQIAGDATASFQNGDPVAFLLTAPAIAPSPTGISIASVPTFDGTNTTFNLSGAIDATSTAGEIADTNFGATSVCIGGVGSNQTLGDASSIVGGQGNLTTATASSARAGGIFAKATRISQDAWASGSDGVTPGNIQTSKVVLSGTTDGTSQNQSVELLLDGNPALETDDAFAYTMRLTAIVNGLIGGVRTTQTFDIVVTAHNDGGVAAIDAQAPALPQQGSAGGAPWSITVTTNGNRIVFTFNTNATQAQTVVAARLEFTEAFLTL